MKTLSITKKPKIKTKNENIKTIKTKKQTKMSKPEV